MLYCDKIRFLFRKLVHIVLIHEKRGFEFTLNDFLYVFVSLFFNDAGYDCVLIAFVLN